jgi:hypothetical protein
MARGQIGFGDEVNLDTARWGGRRRPSLQTKLPFLDYKSVLAFVAVVHFPHLFEIVEPAHDVGRPELLAGSNLLAVQLLDETKDLLLR